jgi:hypothetical protein
MAYQTTEEERKQRSGQIKALITVVISVIEFTSTYN